ncbi:MAG: gliding motility-associated C-terminal domain-containing protein [Bacteroidota bacterium]
MGQEICDNGIDDDGDGFIDLNDDDCECTALLPSSLIPNPSFEERTCCPTMNARLDCAIGWIQASAPTTDYVHTCGNYLGNTNIPAFAPLPFPDGQGAVGFRDGQKDVGDSYKEYVGACLAKTMEVGESYRLDFFVGFRDDVIGNKNVDIAIFGAVDCSRLPFGNGSISIGCPANTGFYDEIDNQSVSGSNEWVNISFEFTPLKPYNVIVIGPRCEGNPNYIHDPYFYLDGLTLAESGEFGIPIDNIEGSICNDDLVLSIIEESDQTYQWYKDGIALPGETNASLNLTNSQGVEGNYLVTIEFLDGCISSQSYTVRVPPYYASQEVTICENEEHIIGTTSFSQAGTYQTTIPANDGCDSIITLTLNVDPSSETILEETFCEGETFEFMDISTQLPGSYQTLLQNSIGCDSTIFIELSEIPMTDGIDLPDEINLTLGDFISVMPDAYDPLLINFVWYNAQGDSIGGLPNLNSFRPLDNTSLTLIGTDEYGCTSEAIVSLRVDKSSITLHVPNIFSPDGNRINDTFSFIPTGALQSVEVFEIYDRWGNLMFQDTPLFNFHNYEGWDGTKDGKEVTQGVYGYRISATFLDGSTKDFIGDLTLIRLN